MTEQPNRSTAPDCDWSAYWAKRSMPWRTEDEIDSERQRFLSERRAVSPDIERGTYPFGGIKLSRADVEWLLATHESRGVIGPVWWDLEVHKPADQRREGLDLRAADLRSQTGYQTDLRQLPLAAMRGGLTFSEALNAADEQVEQAAVRLEHTDLIGTHLEAAYLRYAHLDRASLRGAHLEEAALRGAHLEGANLTEAHLEGAKMGAAHLEGTNLDEAHLVGAFLAEAHLEGASLRSAHLEGANLAEAHLEGASLAEAHLEDALLAGARLEGAKLHKAHLEGASLRSAHLEGANLAEAHLEGKPVLAEDWARVRMWWPGFDQVMVPADVRRAFFSTSSSLDGAILGTSKTGSISVVGTHWNGVDVSAVTWTQPLQERVRRRPKPVVLGDERLARQKKDENGKPKSAARRLMEFEAAVRANRQLAMALRDQGLNEDADRFAYRSQMLQRKVLRCQGRVGQAFASWLLDLVAGYGYRPLRSVVAYLIIICLFASLYLLSALFTVVRFTWDEALVLSVSSFHGGGFFDFNLGMGTALARLAAGESVVGMLFEISLITTFTKRFFAR